MLTTFPPRLCPQLLREAGVPAPNSFHVHVRLNGEFYGLFAFVEMVDDTFLKVGQRVGAQVKNKCG